MDYPARGFGVEAGLGQTISEGYEYEYQYVVIPSLDGELDGPVEILVTDGSDNAGNPITPSHRETQAFIVDSLAPVLFRRNITPADGSIISSAPAPLRLVMREHPDTKGGETFGSGPDPTTVTVTAFGPIESQALTMNNYGSLGNFWSKNGRFLSRSIDYEYRWYISFSDIDEGQGW